MGWSDDLSPRVARGETLVSLVDYVLESEHVERPWQEVRGVLVERFALSYDHARLTVAAVKRGKAHAATASPMDERDRAENPIAWIADQRARDRPVEVPRADLRAATERAEALITKAFMDGRMLGTDDVDVALMVAKLAIARAPDAPTRVDAQNTLTLAATALSSAIEGLIDARGPERCAPEGSQAWVDGIALAAASRQIAEQFAVRGWRDLEQRSLGMRGRAVTGLLGQCHARVGEVMLDRVRSARAEGDDADAAALCEAVVRDFEVVVDRCEAMSAAPFDEHRIALEHLRAALDELTAIRGELAPGAGSLRARCVVLLARTAMEQVGPRAVLLSRIAASLGEHFTETAGDARVEGDTVLAATDCLRIEVEPREVQPGTAHVHVFAALPDELELEACVYGSGASVDEALAQAADVWIDAAGAPIVSVLAAQPQGASVPFEGTEPWGVHSCRGFVGSTALRRGSNDPQAFASAPLFTGHSFDLDDGELHVIKAVLMAKDGRWERILELDGHTDKYVDAWPDGPPCPDEPTLMVRFAIARGRGARRSPPVRSHEDSPDEATVRRALAVFARCTAMDDRQLTEALRRAGFESDVVDALVEQVPTAFFRVEAAASGATFSPNYQRLRVDGTMTPERPLTELPIYVAALEVARSGITKRQLAAASRRSAEADVASKLNDTGSRATPQNITFTSVVFVDPRPRSNSAGGGEVASVRRYGSAVSEAGKFSLLHRKPLLLLMLAIAIVIAWRILA